MASTPLYKFLKTNGNSFYCFPSSAEDISAAYQNTNYKMYFSKFVLLNLPKQNIESGSGTMSNPVVFDFDVFEKSVNYTPPANFGDAIIESLRNYVANHEVSMHESKINPTTYYYDQTSMETPSEKIFFKWAKKLNIIDFEPAIPNDEYFSDMLDFKRYNITDDEYFPEYLWKEREVLPWYIISVEGTSDGVKITYDGTTNFREGDVIRIFDVSNTTISGYIPGCEKTEGVHGKITSIEKEEVTLNDIAILNISVGVFGPETETTGQSELVYNRLVQYIGEITGVSNVQESNRNYTEVHAQVPDHCGQTPDVLFRTMYDVNYKPSLTIPILPSQYQPEIVGAETFNSPIVSDPLEYPGSYFAHFDTADFTYETANGDTIRRSGDYFGISGLITNPIVDGSTIDGISLDFDTTHYVKMNIYKRTLYNFDQFNAIEINNEPPIDFEFNAILWYYTIERTDLNGVVSKKTNLYGISFLDHPDNNPIEFEKGERFPAYKKLVSNGEQDGTSYGFNLSLNFNIINDNPILPYNPEAINSVFSMGLFNSAMSKLSSLNDSFSNIISNNSSINTEILNLKQLLYTQTDISVINNKIKNLESLLRLYSTNQIIESSDIYPEMVLTESLPNIQLFTKDTPYSYIDILKTSDLYSETLSIPRSITVPKYKSFMVMVINDDTTNYTLSDNERLKISFTSDLSYKQYVDIYITGTDTSTENKKLDIYIDSIVPSTYSTDSISENTTEYSSVSEFLIVGNIDLPVYYNTSTSYQNSAYTWKDFKFEIDFNESIEYDENNILEIPIEGNTYLVENSIKPGDTLYLNNFFLGTSSVFDFSGQFVVNSVKGSTVSIMNGDVNLITYMEDFDKPYIIHSSTQSLLSNKPYFTLNKGVKIRITRINSSNNLDVYQKYNIEVSNLE